MSNPRLGIAIVVLALLLREIVVLLWNRNNEAPFTNRTRSRRWTIAKWLLIILMICISALKL